MDDFGIWSHADGGFIEAQFWGENTARTQMQRLITAGDYDADELEVRRVCPEHEDEPADYCETCATESDEDDTDEEDDADD